MVKHMCKILINKLLCNIWGYPSSVAEDSRLKLRYATLVGLTDPEDEAATNLQNVCNYLPFDMA
jgi:hypothetical protein